MLPDGPLRREGKILGPMDRPPDARLRVTYHLLCGPGETPEQKGRDIAYEQTVELPVGCAPDHVEARFPGRVEGIVPLDASRHEVVISYDLDGVGHELPQLLNVLFGNVSIKSGIRVVGVEWPAALLSRFPGPRFGIEGLRKMTGVGARPLLCAALKPMGLSARELASRCLELALGGIDVIKDDHGIADQSMAPFAERVPRCREALELARRETGRACLYLPNVTGPYDEMPHRRDLARATGCAGVLVSPFLVGVDVLRWLRDTSDLFLLAHPALSGALLQPSHGIAGDVLYGQILRLAGADAVIYTNVGGRFPVTEEECVAINLRLREPMGALRPALPVPGGGIDVARVPRFVERYGPDTMFLIGGSFYVQPDLRRAVATLVETLERLVPSRHR